MKKILRYLICIAFFSCQTEQVQFEDLISQVIMPRKEIIADGKDAISVKLIFNKEADISKISANASITNGVFEETGTNELKIKPIRNMENAEFRSVCT